MILFLLYFFPSIFAFVFLIFVFVFQCIFALLIRIDLFDDINLLLLFNSLMLVLIVDAKKLCFYNAAATATAARLFALSFA